MKLLKIGDKIPDFSCLDDKGNLITNQSLKGKKTVIFFYPRANTPGCTAQACNLSENFSILSENGYSIIGISPDKVKSQSNFSQKFGMSHLFYLVLRFMLNIILKMKYM